jgi:hypothetical protein
MAEKELDILVPDDKLRSGFLAMFAGCRSPATVYPNGHFFCGKAECEWIWPGGWEKLRDLGLIEYRIEDVKCHDGAIMKKVHLTITKRGDNMRDDWWK